MFQSDYFLFIYHLIAPPILSGARMILLQVEEHYWFALFAMGRGDGWGCYGFMQQQSSLDHVWGALLVDSWSV